MKRHDRIRDAFSPLLDGELTDEEREAIEEELAEESELLRELDGLRQVDSLYRALPNERAPDDFESSVRAGIDRERFREQSRRRFWPAVAPFLAAAAVIAVVAGVVFQVAGPDEGRFEMAAEAPQESPPARAESAEVAQDLTMLAEERQPVPEGKDTPEADDARTLGAELASPPPPAAPAPAPIEGTVETMEQAADEDMAKAESRASAFADSSAAAPAAEPVAPQAEQEMAAGEVAGLGATGRSAPALTVGERRFTREGDTWREVGYEGQETEDLTRDAANLPDLIPDEVEREAILALRGPVIFKVGDTWYRILRPAP